MMAMEVQSVNTKSFKRYTQSCAPPSTSHSHTVHCVEELKDDSVVYMCTTSGGTTDCDKECIPRAVTLCLPFLHALQKLTHGGSLGTHELLPEPILKDDLSKHPLPDGLKAVLQEGGGGGGDQCTTHSHRVVR